MQPTGFVFRSSLYEAINHFEEPLRGKIALWAIEYGFTGKIEECPEPFRIALKPHLDSIDAQKRRYYNVEIIKKCREAVEILLNSSSVREGIRSNFERMDNDLKKLYRKCKTSDIKDISKILVDCCDKFIIDWSQQGYEENDFHSQKVLICQFKKILQEKSDKSYAERMKSYEKARIKR